MSCSQIEIVGSVHSLICSSCHRVLQKATGPNLGQALGRNSCDQILFHLADFVMLLQLCLVSSHNDRLCRSSAFPFSSAQLSARALAATRLGGPHERRFNFMPRHTTKIRVITEQFGLQSRRQPAFHKLQVSFSGSTKKSASNQLLDALVWPASGPFRNKLRNLTQANFRPLSLQDTLGHEEVLCGTGPIKPSPIHILGDLTRAHHVVPIRKFRPLFLLTSFAVLRESHRHRTAKRHVGDVD